MKIGRYRIAFGWACWLQTHGPVSVRRFLRFVWIIREVRPEDIDKKQRFPLGTPMMAEGRRYRYYKAGKDIVVGGPVGWYETVGFVGPKYGAWKRYVEADKQAKDGVLEGKR